jgi:hypothetical protein
MSTTTDLPSLATITDLEAYLGRTVTDPAQAQALLDNASGAVRRLCGQTISLVIGDVEIHDAPYSRYLLLREIPVLAVASIVSEGMTLDPSTYRVATRTGAIWANSPFGWGWGSSLTWPDWSDRQSIVVTYDHGYAEIPPDVVGVVCAMTDRALAGAGGGGIKMELIGGYRYDLGPNADIGGVGLSSAEAEIIDSYRVPQQVIP